MSLHVFVYGTLKRGQCREACWPAAPEEVRLAWTRGELYDTGPYPAMLPGEGWVAGELWSFDPAQAARVLAALDRVEGTNQPGFENEYDRATVTVFLDDGQQLAAETYFYARRDQLRHLRRVPPAPSWNDLPMASWPSQLD